MCGVCMPDYQHACDASLYSCVYVSDSVCVYLNACLRAYVHCCMQTRMMVWVYVSMCIALYNGHYGSYSMYILPGVHLVCVCPLWRCIHLSSFACLCMIRYVTVRLWVRMHVSVRRCSTLPPRSVHICVGWYCGLAIVLYATTLACPHVCRTVCRSVYVSVSGHVNVSIHVVAAVYVLEYEYVSITTYASLHICIDV